jgi:hypothetical protein
MKQLITLIAVACLAAAVPAQQVEQPLAFALDAQEAALAGETAFLANQLIVRLDDVSDLAAARALLDGERWIVSEPLMPSIGLYLVTLLDGTRVPDAMLELTGRPGVRYAVPDHVVTPRATLPDDPSFGNQWCHTKMQSTFAWDLGQGSQDFVVSVVDGGCLITHADLAANLYQNLAELSGEPGVDDDGNGYVDDFHGWNAYGNNGSIPNDGHGTHVNGIVGAVGNNGLGVAGVNWNVTLMPVAGSSSSTSTVVKAYTYSLDQKLLWMNSGGVLGANVVSTNSSFGIDFANCFSPAYQPWNDAFDALGGVGILSCGATMNINVNVDQTGDVPTGCPSDWMIAVTNTTSSDVKNSGAAYGATTIDLGAPGTGIYSTYSNGGYTNMTGTSMASPQVAGAIAFLHSVASPDLEALRITDPDQAALVVKQLMIDTVDSLPSLEGVTVSGGRLNLYQAGLASSLWFEGPSPWLDLGGGVAGAFGLPVLEGYGPLVVGSQTGLSVIEAGPSLPASLVIGLSLLGAPFKGGTLVPMPDLILGGMTTEADGTLDISERWPPGIPPGFTTWFQFWLVDATGPQGLTASNGVSGTTP